MDVADNVVIDEDGVIESRRGNANYGDSLPTSSDRVKQILFYKQRILRHYNSILQLDDSTGAFSDFSASLDEVESGIRIKYKEVNGNLFITSSEGIKKISASTVGELTVDSLTSAGGIKAVDLEVDSKFETGGFLTPESKCAYRVLFGTKDNNNNVILGTPSARVIATNVSKEIKISEVSAITVTGALTASEYILISTPSTDYYLWFNIGGSDLEPQEADTIGKTAIEATILAGINNTENANRIANALAKVGAFDVSVVGAIVTASSIETGNADDTSSAAVGITTSSTDGSVTVGDFANVDLTFTLPSDITIDYFYQIYRTGVFEASAVLPLDSVEPGDEMNLVLEAGITDANISAGEVTAEDITPESFRQAGAFLYTNPVTGEGILQANEKPPIATDIELFRDSTFYSNTKTFHRLELDLLSVSGFTSGTTELIIGNKTAATSYTFVGAAQETTIVCDTVALTAKDSVILINSARDETLYYIWLDKDQGTDPVIANRTKIRVDISGLDSAADVSAKMASTIGILDEFITTDLTGSLTILNHKNGNTLNATKGTPPPAADPAWVVTTSIDGDGEDAGINDVLLSSNPSVSLSIDETARSLVKIINRDNSGIVNAFYLSGPDDLPGQILLENKNLADIDFHVAINEATPATKFNPELPIIQTLTAISIANSAVITSATHGLLTGDTVYLYDTDSTPAILGHYSITKIDNDNFSVEATTTVGGTTGSYFKTDVTSDNEVSPNRIYFSKTQQPESVPLLNYIAIGSKDSAILRILALRDNLFVLKEDGIHIVTGSTAPNFSVRLLDSSSRIISADSAAVINNQIFALTTEGVVAITETGVSVMSRPIEDQILKVTNKGYNFNTTSFGLSYESDKSYLIWLPTKREDTHATQCFRYNTHTRTWTRFDESVSAVCGGVNPENDTMYLGSATREYMLQERKDDERTDYSDQEIAGAIQPDGVVGTSVKLSTVAGLKVGDVLLQQQYITLSYLKFILRRLDIDSGLTDQDYESTLNGVVGGNIKLNLDALNIKLLADDSSGTVTSRTFSTTLQPQLAEMNALIAELNSANCDTNLKDYKEQDQTPAYEAIIEEINVLGNLVTLNIELPLLEGAITIYRGITMTVVYAPQTFGDPSLLKQVREGTFIFDQRTFYSAMVAYASDQSPDLIEVDFKGEGIGDFGVANWGETNWGGDSDDAPLRTLIPLEKQRCRYIVVKFQHINAREIVRLLGISLEPRSLSRRAYA